MNAQFIAPAAIVAALAFAAAIMIFRPALMRRVVSMLAVLPADGFAEIYTPADRVFLWVRAAAVLISPAAFSLALANNAAAVAVRSPNLLMLPVVALIVDWLLMAVSAVPGVGSHALALLRAAILVFSLCMALFASAMQEKANLLASLIRQEDARTESDVGYQRLLKESEDLAAQLQKNKEDIAKDAAIKRDLEERIKEEQRLHDLECSSDPHIDKYSHQFIAGKACKGKAKGHQINAESMRSRLKSKPPTDLSKQINDQMVEVNQKMTDEITKGRSDPESNGTLLMALFGGSISTGLWISLSFNAATMLITEALAFIVSAIPLTDTIKKALELSRARDGKRLANQHSIQSALIDKKRREERDKAGLGLSPVTVSAVRPNLRVVGDESATTTNEKQEA